MKIKKTPHRRRTLITASLIAALLLATLVTYALYTFLTRQPVSNSGINYAPATKEDKELNDRIKKDLENDTDSSEDTSRDAAPAQPENVEKRTVNVVISAYGQPNGPSSDFTVNGYTPDVIEKEGTCTLTMTKNGVEATTSKAALVNAQSTSCGQLVMSFDKLSTGTWNAVLSYSSPYSSGSSKVTTVEVK